MGAVAMVGLLSGCATGGAAAGSAPVEPSGSAVTGASPVVESSVVPTPSDVAPTAASSAATIRDAVDWDSGKGTPEKPEIDPSPVGWYEAAFGGTADQQGRTLYVTFDDGPGAATSQVLALLEQFDAKATFFVIGREAAANPDSVAAVLAAGHAVGNHTWSHSDLASLSRDEVVAELTSTSQSAAGIGSCMRPPYGSIDANSGAASEDLGLQPIMWTGQAFDWRPPSVPTIVADIKAVTKPGAVILLHDGGGDRSNTVEALRQLLPYWSAEGYSLEPIAACA